MQWVAYGYDEIERGDARKAKLGAVHRRCSPMLVSRSRGWRQSIQLTGILVSRSGVSYFFLSQPTDRPFGVCGPFTDAVTGAVTGAVATTVSVTGRVTEAPPTTLSVILPLYVPTAAAPATALTVTIPLPVPEIRLKFNHVALSLAVQLSVPPPVLLMFKF